MTVTYKPLDRFPSIQVPILHSVAYGRRKLNYEHPKDAEIREWLRENCKHMYYTYPSWMDQYGVQFEDDDEAMMFSLTWCGS